MPPPELDRNERARIEALLRVLSVPAERRGGSAAQTVDVEERKQNLAARERYTERMFWMMVGWLGTLLVILLAQGCELTLEPCCTVAFDLDSSVLVTLISTTTATVAAMFYIVIRHIFPGH